MTTRCVEYHHYYPNTDLWLRRENEGRKGRNHGVCLTSLVALVPQVLTLVSNERVPLSDAMRMVFEINSLKNATPATVSRAGILFINETGEHISFVDVSSGTVPLALMVEGIMLPSHRLLLPLMFMLFMFFIFPRPPLHTASLE